MRSAALHKPRTDRPPVTDVPVAPPAQRAPMMPLQPATPIGGSWARRVYGDNLLLIIALVLAGYAIFGRGFAYVGVSPVFIGEVTLLAGLLGVLIIPGWFDIFHQSTALILLPMVAWGALRTYPYLGVYGVSAVRDAAVYAYSLFAIVIAALLVADPYRLPRLIRWYRKFAPAFLIGTIVVFFIYRFIRPSFLHWPGSDVLLIQQKEGDQLVHLAGVAAFCAAEFWLNPRAWVIVLTIGAALMAATERAGLISLGAVLGLFSWAKPRDRTARNVLLIFVFGVMGLWATDIRIPVPGGKGRDLSFQQIITNVLSIGGSSGREGMDSTKEWRMDWWGSIIDYTVLGPFRWKGKGFGINLADDDGFQVLSDKSLRSPHSVHMTMLARGGVPLLMAWIAIQIVWGTQIFRAYLRAWRHGDWRWANLFLFLFAYWIACLINASFDVFLEGPMGGIWFWSIYGVGMAALWIYPRFPAVMEEAMA